ETDCQVDCRNTKRCDSRICSGGRSCTIYCGPDSCKETSCTSKSCSFDCQGGDHACEKVSCAAAEECTFSCNAINACKNATCDAGRCTFDCRASGSCSEALRVEAETCRINCSSEGSCAANTISCGSSRHSSIRCANNACNTKPSCAPPADGGCDIVCG